MTKLIWLAAALAACADPAVGRSIEDIAPPPPSADAIALARARLAWGVRLLAVVADDGAAIDGIDLGPLDEPILTRVATGGIAALAGAAATGPAVRVPYEALLPPVDVAGAAVAVGANYPDPADPAAEPFLIALTGRLAPPSGAVAAASDELLDYRAGLCMVLGEDVASPAELADASVGFFLCAQLVDRAGELRGLDLAQPAPADRATAEAARPGYWRGGPYMYHAPRWRSYVDEAATQLARDGEVAQDAVAAAMIWPIEEIAARALAASRLSNTLLEDAVLPAGLVLFTGAPASTAFRLPSRELIEDASRDYVLDGGYLTGMSFDAYVKAWFVAHERASGRYLGPGDRLDVAGRRIGQVHLAIE